VIFKTGGRRVDPVSGAFDSHTLPPIILNNLAYGNASDLASKKPPACAECDEDVILRPLLPIFYNPFIF
jgi:hypothetical protein